MVVGHIIVGACVYARGCKPHGGGQEIVGVKGMAAGRWKGGVGEQKCLHELAPSVFPPVNYFL